MAHVHARRGAGPEVPPTKIAAALDLQEEVRALAGHLEHAAQLALIAAEGEEPEHGAEYLLDTLNDLGPRLVALRAKLRRQ